MKFIGERRALAASVFAFFFVYLTLVLLSPDVPGQLKPMFWGLAGVYGLAFFGLIAGYFWARWYAVGVGLWGVILGALLLWQGGVHPVFLFVGGSHLTATLLLWGNGMSEAYDGKANWREKFHMDENAVNRLGRSVIRAGVSLPFVLLYALQPRTGGVELVASLSALALTGLGIRGIIRLRTWGLMAMAAAGVILLALAGNDAVYGESIAVLKPALAGGLLLSAVAPWLRRV
jgi:hypothetical protein